MVRHCYPILLFVATIGAVVVCIRPQWGARWLAQIETWTQKAQAASPLDDSSPLQNTVPPFSPFPSIQTTPPAKPTSVGRGSQWPIPPETSDLPDSDQIIPGESIPYPSSGQADPTEPSRSARLEQGAPFSENKGLEKGLPQERLPPGRGGFRETPSPTPLQWGGNLPRSEAGPREAFPPLASRPLSERNPYEGTDSETDPLAEKTPCEGARAVARVGADVVLMSDVWVTAEQFLISLYWRQKSQTQQLPPPPPLEGILAQRESFVQSQFPHLIRQLVDAKLAYYDALNTIPQEALKNMEEQVAKHFEKVELPKFLDFYRVQTYQELDLRLRGGGTSLARHRRLYFERTLAAQWLAQKVKVNEDVGYEEMWAWYQQHLGEFEQPAKARWEQISVRISKYPSRQAAWAALAQAGNQVLDGRPFAEVARQFSDAPNAAEGGLRDWTSLGSLRSEILNQALFTLPVGAMSPILEDGDWLHIVRVIDRQEARRIPFVEAQVKIREEIRKQRTQIQHQAYLDQLRQRAPVWTVLDDRAGRPRTASFPRENF